MLRLKACFLTVVFLVAGVSFFIAPNTKSSASVMRLTQTAEQAINLNPSLSDDGRVVVFESSANLAAGSVNSSFHAVRADIRGQPPGLQDLGATRVVSPALSSDGSVIAFASTEDLVGENADRNSEIFLFTGADLKQLTHTLPDSSATRLVDGNSQVSITSDGKLVAFTSRGNLLLYDVATEAFSQLTDGLNPKISGDGSRLYYQRGSDLVSLDLKTKTSRVIAADVPKLSIGTGRAVSDDGLRFVYAAEVAPNQTQVFLFDARGNTIRQITQLGSRSVDVPLHPTISGDGKRVAFATRRRVTNASDGSVELYLYDIPSGQTQQVTNAPAGATAEAVSSLNVDGSLVAFSFPRVLSGPVADNDASNNHEIYLATLAERPQFGSATVMNAAALGNEPSQPALLAPGSIATIRGDALGLRTETGISADPPSALAGTTVTVNGRAARIFFASPREVIFVVPEGLPPGPAEIVVTNSDGFSSKAETVIANSAPGIFTTTGDGTGEAIVLDSDTQTASPFDPSSGRLRLSIFATGLTSAHDRSASINGQPIPIETVAQSGLAGLDEIHLLVPLELRGSGTSTLIVTADGVQSNPVTLLLGGSALRDIVINEILADPPDGIAGDANHDGVRDTADDEFIELVNSTTRDLDLSGFQLQTRSLTGTTDTLRHRFAPGTLLPAGTAIVIFGGGTFTTPNSPTFTNPVFGNSQILKASTGSLSLTNSGAVVTLRNATGEIVTSVSYGSSLGLRGDLNQSLTRSPDITGPFSTHSTAPGSENRNFSPGTKVDGSLFLRLTPPPTPTPTPTPTPIPTPIPSPTPTPTPIPTPIATPSPTPTPTATPTPTPSPSPSATPIPSPSPSPTATPIPTPTASPTPTPTPTANPKIVISQLFGGGGNANAPLRNDFIELFNNGPSPIDLTGWSVQYASATATNWSVTSLTPITLQPGHYYLVQQASGGTNGALIPTPDTTGTIAMAATSGKVALVRSTTALQGACPADPNIIDLVGYGSTASCFKGTAPAPAPSNTNAISRNEAGCANTQNNNTDFKTNPPNPRNIASPVNMCPELTAALENLKHALSLRRSHFPSRTLRLRQLPRRPT